MKKVRCPYFELNDLERAYHDKEWGTPCRNDRKLFEYLMYEVLQCGLSWDTIIQKRAAFRVAFERFDFEKIARYVERDIARVLAVPGMIRSRRKIEAIIHYAQRFIALRRECGTFRLGDGLCVHAVRRPRQRPRAFLLPLQGAVAARPSQHRVRVWRQKVI